MAHPTPTHALVPTHYHPPPPKKPPAAPDAWPMPAFRLRVEDLSHPGAELFFEHVNPLEALREAVTSVFEWLYTLETVPRHVETVVLVLRSMPGAAHCSGTDIYKEIHFSLEHIQNNATRVKAEVFGVLTHEMVHAYQYNGRGTCPGGLVEGMADWVRLNAGYRPPHWSSSSLGDKWDAGYAQTAFLLSYIESKYGIDAIRAINLTMRDREYEDRIFKEHTGRKIKGLWKDYKAFVTEGAQEGKDAKEKEGENGDAKAKGEEDTKLEDARKKLWKILGK